MNPNVRSKARLLGVSVLLLLGVGIFASANLPEAQASSSYLTAAEAQYPSIIGTPLDSCNLCHTSIPPRNSYGNDFASHNRSFTAIENLDSDGDGFTNIVEINALTFPGDPNSHPAPAATATSTNVPPTMTPTATATPTNTTLPPTMTPTMNSKPTKPKLPQTMTPTMN